MANENGLSRTPASGRSTPPDAATTASDTDAPHFSPPCGPIRGWRDGAVVRATGIPYATAARFERPAPAPDWSEPLEATEWSPACPQHEVPLLEEALGRGFGLLPETEHCQNLSVTAPADARPGEGLPVMVWIHGGSYTSGAGDLPIMDPAALVAEQRVVVVTVTYRLGIFGYLGDDAGRPANLGLLDQIAALEWVQRNIEAFGGDPRRVTAFGQSAGGDAVAHIMATPGAARLFSRAIIQSAPLGISRGRAAMNAEMARAASTVTAETDAADVVAAELDVTAAAGPRFGLRSAMPFGTQYGHAPLPAERDLEAAWDAVAPEIEVLIGRTAEEAGLFLPRATPLHPWLALPVVGPALKRVLVGAVTAVVYGRAARRFARRHARAGGLAYHYVIEWSAPGNPFGSAHTIDLPLLFGDEQTWSQATLVAGADWAEIHDRGRRMRRLWGDFARGTSLRSGGRIPGVVRFRKA